MDITSLPSTCHDKLPEAVIKASTTDFCVDEELGFDPAGEGEHLWVSIRKSGWNTRDVIELVARELALAARDIGYSGLKDRQAVTTQWLSIPLARLSNRQAAQDSIEQIMQRENDLECLRIVTGQRKLKPGSHRSNRFTIVLRKLNCGAQLIEPQLQALTTQGFPNYFGVQRFGHQSSNLLRAESMFRGKQRVSKFKRGIYLSAARAYLFNLVLAERVRAGSWNQIVNGELCILDGSNSVFSCNQPDDTARKRCAEFDIHPSGPMAGRGENRVSGLVAELEHRVLSANQVLSDGLANAGLKMERRSLRAVPAKFTWQWIEKDSLELSFTLRRGIYATSLLAEIANVSDVSHQSTLNNANGQGA